MFNSNRPEKSELEKALDRALRKLDELDVHTEEYANTLDRVSKLHKMKEDEKPDSVSKDSLFRSAANLLGILLIIHHERVNIITSKALPFVAKP